MRWYHGSTKPIEQLGTAGSGMNLWGSVGAYLSGSPDAASRFGHIVNHFDDASVVALYTDEPVSDEHIDLMFESLKHFKLPMNTLNYVANEVRTYGDWIALLGEYVGDRSKGVLYMQERLGFNALYTRDVSGTLNGESFSEGDVLVILDPAAVRHVASEMVRCPPDVYFHGSRHREPIQKFKHGEHPATAGWAGFGSYEVERHAFFFSHDPRMSAQFGQVHAYEIKPRKILDLCNDVKEHDAPVLEGAGLSVRAIDNLYDKWELLDGAGALEFANTLQALGYDAIRYFEADENQIGRPCLAVLTPDVIFPAYLPEPVMAQQTRLWNAADALGETFKQYHGQLTTQQLHTRLSSRAMSCGVSIDPALIEKALLLRQWDVVMDKLSVWNPLAVSAHVQSVKPELHAETAERAIRRTV